MEALSMLKFWKSTTAKVAIDAEIHDRVTVAESTVCDLDLTDDDDDSFFELELTLPKFASKSPNQAIPDLKSDPKITSKPQSPISILRSASPKLRVFMFGIFIKKSKKKRDVDELYYDTESNSSSFSPKSNSNNSNLFTVKFRIEDGSIVPKLTRTNSSKSTSQLSSPKSSRSDGSLSSKRFSKEGIHKYLNFVKPLYSKRSGNRGERITVSSPRRSMSSPSPRREEKLQSSRFYLRGKPFMKSKSASAMIAPSTRVNFPARNDYPCESIEGAILHCKRSLNYTIGQSSLSRCSSDPSYEKSIKVSEYL